MVRIFIITYISPFEVPIALLTKSRGLPSTRITVRLLRFGSSFQRQVVAKAKGFFKGSTEGFGGV